ncbi:transient receptor potential channel pyrexia-like [Scyliorhinus canicula]|uniref:transient receptor potential channel pyrexia-like n=1 Tax=Scyliorhinus canicula TaxID=7830 RepID=UPI0018F49C3E|nr:transient receptor potential channel pyrexia-like [Scyliorhinus canicula]
MSLKKPNQIQPLTIANVSAISNKAQETQKSTLVVTIPGNEDDAEDKWKDYVRKRRLPHKHIPFKTDAELETTDSATYIGLKRITDAGQQVATSNQAVQGQAGTSSQNQSTSTSPTTAFLQYFIIASKRGNDSEIDLERLNTMLENGADINATDRYGQGVLHGAARTWHPDVAKFLIERNADVNKPDNYGVTPLHVAAAKNYPEMVDFLLDCGADVEAKTSGMLQTPVHYAAKYDANNSLHCLLKHDANMKARDYKQRTPLQLATELDRSESAQLLLQCQADAGVHDNTGQSCLTLMAACMSQLAYLALDQFIIKDRANRKQYFMLNLLIPQPSETDNSRAKSLLEVIVQYRQLDLIMHPVVQKLIQIKWKRFGRRGVAIMLILNIFFILSWTILGLTSHLSYDDKLKYNLPGDWWKILIAAIAVALTGSQLIEEFLEIHSSNRNFTRWKDWKAKEIMKDLNLCHPRWPEEESYLKKQLAGLEEMHPSYFKDFWNLFDWMVYLLLFALIATHVADLSMDSDFIHVAHIRLFAVTIIFLWLRLMKHVRAIRALGPFIVMLGKIIIDLLKFLFIYGEFYIPFACAFWIIFGGLVSNMTTLPQMLFTVFRITLVDDYRFEDMYLKDPVMAYFLCGTFLGISSILCINLLIALLSDTFQRVYDNANANAAMQQASIVQYVEDHLSRDRKNTFKEFIHKSCAPLEIFFDDDLTVDQEDDLKKVTIQIKEDIDNLTKLLQREQWEMADYQQSPRSKYFRKSWGNSRSQSQDEDSEEGTTLNIALHEEITNLQLKVSALHEQQENTTSKLTSEMQRTQDLINEILRHIGAGTSGTHSSHEPHGDTQGRTTQ